MTAVFLRCPVSSDDFTGSLPRRGLVAMISHGYADIENDVADFIKCIYSV